MLYVGSIILDAARSRKDGESFLTQEVEVGVAAGAGVNDRGKIAGKIIGVAAADQRKSERELERDLGLADEFSILPTLAVNRDVLLRRDRIHKGLAILAIHDAEGHDAGNKR